MLGVRVYELLRIVRMSTQDPLFHDNFNDALANAVKALGRGKIEPVALELWGPAKPNAGRYLADCLNPERDAKLSIQELVTLLQWAREKGIHWAMHALCEEVGYGEPAIVARKTPEQQLAEQMARAANDYLRLANEAAAAASARLKTVS